MKIAILFSSFLALAACSSAEAMPLTEESSAPATRSEAGFQAPMKRNVAQFGAMILCETKRNPLDFNGYGCYCGVGGQGTPVDEIDRCCYVHDQCYSKITKEKICPFNKAAYTTTYNVKGCSRCAKRSIIGNSRCQKKLCECDAAAAQCFKKYNSKFKNRYKNYAKSSCKTE